MLQSSVIRMVSVVTTSGRPPSYGTLESKEHDFPIPENLAYYSNERDQGSREEATEERCLGAWFSIPYFRWYPRWYISTIRGAEWFHVYLWLAKDLAWTQDWNYIGIISGFSAVFWSIFLLFQVFLAYNSLQFERLNRNSMCIGI